MTFRILGDHLGSVDRDRRGRAGELAAAVHHTLDLQEAVNDLHTLAHLAECGIVAVQEGVLVGVADEELAGSTVLVVGTRHRDNTARMAQRVIHAVGGKLTLDLLLAAACARAARVAALRHKVIDNAVEGQAVVKAVRNEGFKVLTGDRCIFGIERDAERVFRQRSLLRRFCRLLLNICGVYADRCAGTFAAADCHQRNECGSCRDCECLEFHDKKILSLIKIAVGSRRQMISAVYRFRLLFFAG